MFNHGFFCENCGPIEKSKKRTVRKVQTDTCPDCSTVVVPWTRPINERSGRCSNCGYGGFRLAIVKRVLIRCCKKCEEVTNPDTGDVIRKGREI